MKFSLLWLLPALVAAAPIAEKRDVNSLLAKIALLCPFSGAISDISSLLIAAENTLAWVTGTQTTSNDLSGSCKPVTVIFARGTTEPGNVGVLVGPPFFSALKNIVGSGNVAVQGVPYGASIEGFLDGGDAAGSQAMANLVTQAHTNCPSTKIVMGGYSQGGQLVHKAAELLSPTVQAAVNSAIIFGDPDKGASIAGVSASNTLVVCHETDDICLHGDLILLAHLTYASNAQQAASFIAGTLGY